MGGGKWHIDATTGYRKRATRAKKTRGTRGEPIIVANAPLLLVKDAERITHAAKMKGMQPISDIP